jgi:primosomal protein N' (replication factor Y)
MTVPERGVRVLVPFGPRRVVGVVTGPAEIQPGMDLKDVLEIVDEAPLVAPPLLDLAAWTADHYLAPPGECYRLVLPPEGVRASKAVARLVDLAGAPGDPVADALRAGPLKLSTLARRLGRDPASRLARLRRDGVVTVEQDVEARRFRQVRTAILVERSEPALHTTAATTTTTSTSVTTKAKPRGKAQAEVLKRLGDAGGRARVTDLLKDAPSLRGALDRLTKTGDIRIEEERETGALDVMPGEAPGPFAATEDQARILEVLEAAVEQRKYQPFLLHGITGSGKTEVYFRAAERCLALGRGALLLVPEIALTPLLLRAAAARFGETVSVLHSGLTAAERHAQWWRIREGFARVVIGARSAVFAPLPDVGLIVVDEEHEASYKQEDSPRYHGRDVAVVRAKLEGAPVVLGTATPSLESYANAASGKYTRIALPARIGPRGLPRVEVVDRRAVLKSGGDPVITPPLREALEQRLARKEQSLLLLNRRGYATSLICRECGLPALCPNCSVALTLHRGGGTALCHYCAHESRTPQACLYCKGAYLRLTGYGTEKVVEAVKAALPTARVDRLDRDLAQRRGAVERVLAAFEKGETDILVGTQMIAKGHDFPRVTLVGVIDADVGLGLPDFRAAERTFQLLTQVAGRAGRAQLAGEVILQSHLPDHYALRLACAQDYEAFFEREMEFRRTMGYPPVTALLNLVLRARDAPAAATAAEAIGRRLRDAAGGRYRVLGPAKAPLAKLRGEHRYQILLKGQRPAMREAVRAALVAQYGEVRWPGIAVDVDPMTVM